MTSPSSRTTRLPARADIAVIGAGSATSSLIAALDGQPSVVVFEDDLVGGECPYDACIPSKALLHDGRSGRSWQAAAARRRELVHHHDDTSHAESLVRPGVRLVRERATVVDAQHVRCESGVVEVDHIVIATGARPRVPEIDGLELVSDLVWTSDRALRASEPPRRLAIIGGGVIGCEFTDLFTSFGSGVVVYEPEEHLFATLHPEVSASIERAVRATGAEVLLGRRPVDVRPHGERVSVVDDAGEMRRVDRVLIATGRRPNLDGLGLESLGVPSDLPLPIDEHGRVRVAGSIWAIGDAAGREQYTHAATHHGRVVADHLGGSGQRRWDDVVSAACAFLDPPVMTVGPSFTGTADDPDVVWAQVDVGASAARAATDERSGALAVAADRNTRCVVAAHGIGAGFDELVHAVIVAVDGAVPIDRLVQSMVPFPTMGDAWHRALSQLVDELG